MQACTHPCKHARTQARTRSHADTQSAQPGRTVSSGDKVVEFTSEDVSKVVKAVLRQLVNQKSVKTRERSVVDRPTSAPGPAHIFARTRPHLRRDPAHICPGATRSTSSLGPRLGCVHVRTATAPVSAAANAEERHFLRDRDRRRLRRDTLKCQGGHLSGESLRVQARPSPALNCDGFATSGGCSCFELLRELAVAKSGQARRPLAECHLRVPVQLRVCGCVHEVSVCVCVRVCARARVCVSLCVCVCVRASLCMRS
jgi:hypothetical protein